MTSRHRAGRASAAVLAILLAAAPALARPIAGTYDCSGGTSVHVVTITADGCSVDGQAAAPATQTPLECTLEPPAVRVMTVFDDLSFVYTEAGATEADPAIQTTGYCLMR